MRLGPPILGRGYLEAVADSEIERVAAEQAQRTDGIHGRVNHVAYVASPTRTPIHTDTSRAIWSSAASGSRRASPPSTSSPPTRCRATWGSPARCARRRSPNPDGLTDDRKPGVDVTIDSVNMRADYVRMTAIPRRAELDAARGRALFEQAQCGACHVPALRTRADYPIAPLAGIDAPIFTDLLLHDMGDALADGMAKGRPTGRDWRTAPLIGLRFNREFMHDGARATVEEAIAAHASAGSEANGMRGGVRRAVGRRSAGAARVRRAL